MRVAHALLASVLVMAAAAAAQQPSQKPPIGQEHPLFASAPAKLEALLETNVKAEWEAIKKRDKDAYGKLLSDDAIIVEADGDGARNRYKATNELPDTAVHDYHLQLFKTYAFSPKITYVRYECTMEFPAKAALHFKRMWISEIWVLQGKDWKLWRYQETPVR